MPEILPFRGIHYDIRNISLGAVLSPPYDVIPPERQQELYASHPRNAIRLELGREQDRYTSAAEFWREWKIDGTLVQDAQPAIHILRQRFKGRDGEEVRRIGFTALCRLEELGSGTILPHEKTFPKPKEDRLNLLTHTSAQFSPIFSIYADPSKTLEEIYRRVSNSPALLRGDFEGTRIDVWGITDHDLISTLKDVVRTREIFIADGHHRYETALEYQEIRRAENSSHNGTEGYNYTLMYFSNIVEEGLVIYPIHRVVRGMDGFQAGAFLSTLKTEFSVESAEDLEALVLALRGRQRFSYGIALASESRLYLATLKDRSKLDTLVPKQIPVELRELDVVLLHEFVFPRVLKIGVQLTPSHAQVEFIKDEREAVNVVQKGDAQVAFLLNPTRIDQLQAVARAGQTMPQKSTYFYPKLPAGLVMYNLERW